jgi:segregation and condensation protein A
LHLLLELIQHDELPITEVSLARVTEDYLSYISQHEVPADELADFLIIASRLLLIKSKAILPIDDEPVEDQSTLALQLRLYKLFSDAADHLETRYEHAHESFSRPKAMEAPSKEFVVPEGLSVVLLKEAFDGLLKRLEPYFRLQQVAMERVVSVQERIAELHEAILNRSRLSFHHLIRSGASKVDVVVSFLALLELVKRQVVHVMQGDTFSDIEVTRID